MEYIDKAMQIAFAISNVKSLFCPIAFSIIRGNLLQVSSSFIKPHPIFKRTLKILQQRMLHIFLAKYRFISRYFPVYSYAFIQDTDSTVGLWSIIVVTFVLKYSYLTQYGKTMAKPLGMKNCK